MICSKHGNEPEWDELFGAVLSGEASVGEEQRLRKLLGECPACRRTFEELSSFRDGFLKAYPAGEQNVALRAGNRAAVRWLAHPAVATGTALAVAASLAIVLYSGLTPGSAPVPPAIEVPAIDVSDSADEPDVEELVELSWDTELDRTDAFEMMALLTDEELEDWFQEWNQETKGVL